MMLIVVAVLAVAGLALLARTIHQRYPLLPHFRRIRRQIRNAKHVEPKRRR